MRFHLLIALSFVAVVGCKGGGTNDAFATTLPGESQVQTLTTAQATELCTNLTDYLNQQFDAQGFCQAAAIAGTVKAAAEDPSLTDAQLQQGCAAALTQICAQSAPSRAADAGITSCGSTAGCSATVRQISTCASDYAAELAQFEQMFPKCSMITRAGLASVHADASPGEPASCIPLDTSCPNWGPMTTMSAG
jgi:hypothetical protein